MKNIFLTSSLQTVAKSVGEHIDKPAKFLFITTASEVEEGDKTWLKLDIDSMVQAGFEVADYSLTSKTKDDIAKQLAEVNGVVMGGGNTFFLLQQLQQTDSLELFRQFVKEGKYYIGSSAGSIVAGPDLAPSEDLDDLAKAPLLKGTKGLGITDIIVFPHWGSDHFKESYKKCLPNFYTTAHKMVLLNDYQYLVADGSNLQLIDIRKD
ncbi:MAG: Type 1 glutamine amidotransferase-like domain-containing protein [Patescibacteria group bacterium]|jgi:dipeptidase E